VGSAILLGEELAADVFTGVFEERDAGIAALLGAVMDQALLADVNVAAAGAAAPINGLAQRNIFLEPGEVGEAAPSEILELAVDGEFLFTERFKLAAAIVNDADGATEAEFERAAADGESVIRVLRTGAKDGIDVHVEFGVFGEHLQFLVENFEALLGHVVGHDVVDGDLQMVEPGFIEPLDAVRHEEVAVGDHASDAAMAANAGDDLFEIGVEEGLAAANHDERRAQFGQVIDAAEHDADVDRLREVVVLIAVSTRQVTPAHGNDMRLDNVIRGKETLPDHLQFAQASMPRLHFATEPGGKGRHTSVNK